MKKSYEYSHDENFLKKIDNQRLQKQYIKLILLDWKENPLTEIQGFSTGGTLSVNGDSATRQTCNLTMYVPNNEYNITNADNMISINKKIYLEIGVENNQIEYPEHDIIWFPQGVFCITSCSLTRSSNGRTLSLQLRDKSCLLDGTCGGLISSSTQFDEYDTIDENGAFITEKPIIEQIIRELVCHFGGEQLGKILISDIPSRIKAPMKWIGDVPLYKYWISNNGEISYGMTTSQTEAQAATGYQEYNYGEDVGFIYTDFSYPSELVGNAGDSVITILDKIKTTLGNFEYFYDADGNFVFREIKNYLNTTQATVDLEKINNGNYLVDMSKGKSVYSFIDSPLVSSFAHTPQYNQIKNDFVVWGIKKSDQGVEIPIRYHLAIDKKPEIGNVYSVYFYIDPDDGLEKAKVPLKFQNKNNFPYPGTVGLLYLDETQQAVYRWDAVKKSYVAVSGAEIRTYNPSTPGEEGVIYIEDYTGNRYYWGIDENSELFLRKAQEKKVAYQNYLTLISPIEDQIESNLADIKQAEEDLETADSVEKVEEELETFESAATEITEDILHLESQIAALQEEIAATTDELTKLQLQLQIAEIEQEKKTATATLNYYLARIQSSTSYLEWIHSLEQQINQLTEENIELSTEITNYYADYEAEIARLDAESFEYLPTEAFEITKVKTTDWRSELYLQGAMAEPLGLESNYYYPELAAEWPKLYNLKDHMENGVWVGAFRQEFIEKPWEVDYFLDFIDSTEAINEFSVSNIGRRTLVKSEDSFNCIFEPEVPDFVLIESGQVDTEAKRQECQNRGQAFIQVSSSIYNMLAIGGNLNSCFTEIKNLLHNHTQYNGTIQLQGVPLYHIETNTRITVQDVESNIYGDYIVTSLSIPLGTGGTMSLSASKMIDKL